MKRIVLLFVIGIAIFGLSTENAHAQRSGSLQVTARVVDARISMSGLATAHQMASRLARGEQSEGTVETLLSQVSYSIERPAAEAVRPRRAQVTIQYLRN